MMEFWGDALLNMPQVAKKKHVDKGTIYVNNKETQQVRPEDAVYELGIVSYSGSGKYQYSKYLDWNSLPDTENVATEMQLQCSSPEGQGWWPVIALDTRFEKGTKKILVVCWYQLLNNGRIIAWWIYIVDDM